MADLYQDLGQIVPKIEIIQENTTGIDEVKIKITVLENEFITPNLKMNAVDGTMIRLIAFDIEDSANAQKIKQTGYFILNDYMYVLFNQGLMTYVYKQSLTAPDEEIKVFEYNDGALVKEINGIATTGSVESYWIKYFKNRMYVQRWGDTAPADIWDFDGYRWAEVDRQGVFDRPRGNNAPFTAMINGVQTNLVGGGDVGFDGTIHGDRIRDIMGQVNASSASARPGNPAGVFSVVETGKISGGWSQDAYYMLRMGFNASKVVPTGDDNSPIYQTAVYWKLEEI